MTHFSMLAPSFKSLYQMFSFNIVFVFVPTLTCSFRFYINNIINILYKFHCKDNNHKILIYNSISTNSCVTPARCPCMTFLVACILIPSFFFLGGGHIHAIPICNLWILFRDVTEIKHGNHLRTKVRIF